MKRVIKILQGWNPWRLRAENDDLKHRLSELQAEMTRLELNNPVSDTKITAELDKLREKYLKTKTGLAYLMQWVHVTHKLGQPQNILQDTLAKFIQQNKKT